MRVKDKSDRISNQILKQNIEIQPYFYQTWWFKIIVAISIVFLVYAIAGFRARQKQKIAELELEKEKALSSERERISRDIHDSIGARLTKIITDLDIMELKSSDISNSSIEKDIGKTRNYTQDTINNLRETIWTLDSKIVKYSDLLHHTNNFLKRYLPDDISWNVNFDSNIVNRQLNPNMAVNIFRIFQELTQNMLKYSKASKFEIKIFVDSVVYISIYDNGIGFDYEKNSKGEGLSNILKRLNEINGTLKYKIESGSKFEITLNNEL